MAKKRKSVDTGIIPTLVWWCSECEHVEPTQEGYVEDDCEPCVFCGEGCAQVVKSRKLSRSGRKALIAFMAGACMMLLACGGTLDREPPAPQTDASGDVADAQAPEDATPEASPDAEPCGWKCMPYGDGGDLYEDTCTGRYCPGTGGCASHLVENPCADGGT